MMSVLVALPAPCDASPFVANMTLGPLGIDYVHIHNCLLADLPLLSFLLLLLWLGCLFYFLGSTADGYFSPTLASISERLQVSHDVAGVTFLAFGNGAPDIFSAIAAYSSGVGETGVNELLGGAMFISTVVVGGVAVASTVKVQRWPFLRDVGALAAALAVFLLLAVNSSDDIGDSAVAAVVFLAMYAIYVGSVVLPACVGMYRVADDSFCDPKPKEKKSLMISAFWHALTPRGKIIKGRVGNAHQACQSKLITRLADERNKKNNVMEKNVGNFLESKEESAILLTDERPSVHFSSRVFENHFEIAEEDSFSSPLIADDEREIDENDQDVLKWQQHLRWRWRLRRRVLAVFTSDKPLLIKLLCFPQAVLVFARDITVPLFDDGSWSRSKACLSPVTVPLLLAMTSGYANIDMSGGRCAHRIQLWQALTVIGGCTCAIISYSTHRSHAPQSLKSSGLLLSLAFTACVCWIYTVANELMALLVAVGYITHVSNSLLGLTVLAWGNSVGDLITDVSVARAGFPRMAIAGCFGGPVLNLLLGLGLPMAFAFVSGSSAKLSLDVHAWISLSFLSVSLVSSLLVFRHYTYRCPSWFGKVLMGFYVIYSIVNVMIAIFKGQRSDPL